MTTSDAQPQSAGTQPENATGEAFHCPASFAQERLWFLDQFEPNSALYNLLSVFRMKGQLSLPALQYSIDNIIERHETLRTIFGTEDERPIQIILPKLHLPIRIEDISAVPSDQREAEMTRLVQEAVNRPFDLTRGPLIRMMVIKMADDEHVMAITYHHIIYDGWSAAVFFKELNAFYTAYLNAQPAQVPELSVQYADYAAWQKEWLQGEALDQEMAFWREHLAGAPALIEIPADRPRPAAQTFQGARMLFSLTRELTDAIEQLSRKHNVTVFMTLLSALEVLLGRYTNQHDFVIGTPIAGRTRVELEPLIGFFANTLVLRADLAGDPTFLDVLRRVRDTALNAFVHQEVPFEKIVEELQPERSLSYNPLFQVMFAFQTLSKDQKDQLELGPLQLSDINIQRVTSKFDLTLSFWNDADEGGLLKGSFEYNTDLFDAATLQRMEQNLITLLNSVVRQPEQRISLLPVLSDAERHQISVEWNATQTDIPLDRCVHQLIADQARLTPEMPAVTDEMQTLSYADLNRRANQLAHHLRRLGVDVDQPVGLCVNRSVDMIVAMLGVLKAGGAYVPLDPEYPAERLAFMAVDARLAALIVHGQTAHLVPSFAGPRVQIDGDWATIAQEDATDPFVQALPTDLAYIIYTSGSTGVPKGVQIPQAALVNFLASMRTTPGMTAQDVSLALTSISFDIAGLEIFLPLTLGSRVVVVSRDVAIDAQQLARVIDESGVTVVQATPATWRALIDTGWRGGPGLKLLSGGEALSRDLAQALLERGGSLWNMYGPTETTIWSTIHHVVSAEGPISIGRPIANTQIYILDEQLQVVPIGVPGELYIGGAGLARGYRNRPDLTAERFISDPFTQISDARLYRTGDAARYRPDGTIEYLGRLDSQVKVRGFRIELGEIETVLEQHPDVNQAVVVVREDVPGDQRIIAYLIGKESTPEANALRAFAQTRLPAYMIPSTFVTLSEFPLTPNGKVDRRALPAPEGDLVAGTAYVAPSTPEEILMAEVWADILDLPQIGAEDNFFELGGHSLLATKMMSRVRDAFQVEVPLRTLFEAPTLATFALAVAQIKEHAPTQKAPLAPIARSARRQQNGNTYS
jgi:amino acid adenylation domain-containing protein